jgi:outer membrane protein OmpA-like peptidoglycan-associated protein
MRARSRSLVTVLLLVIVAGCRPSAPESSAIPPSTPAPQAQPAAAQPRTAAAPATPADSSTTPAEKPASPLSEIASALGLGGVGSNVPDGLVADGECPPPPSDAAQEISAQANAAVPLKEGLTLVSLWRPTSQDEYECLLQIAKIGNTDIMTTMSCNAPGRDQVSPRRVCRSDLRNARMLHTQYGTFKIMNASGEYEPESITGATAFSLSSEQFARLKSDRRLQYHYVQFAPSERLDIDEVGELRVEGHETATVVVNDKPVTLPVIKLAGKLNSWNRGKRVENEASALVLDDERFPLLVDVWSHNDSNEFRVNFSKITYPNAGRKDSLEDNLLENQKVDVYGIYFDFNSDRIRPESEPVLQEIRSVMERHSDWKLGISGHTDNVGGNGDYNLQLSRRRSEAVRTTLIKRFGISADRLTSGGYGAGAPKDTNDTPEGRARNRRVELVRQ